ncbi:Hint domain-containing protein [Oligoflexus tunisiensis]|uniref:Hint domain-containing protein n=1 Tax=Oligoflexus tunisiensis TaxID=708132 RepID=UPI00114D1FD5|nr:Hint domain-containing protein [Oligoflexus tunisiensis]
MAFHTQPGEQGSAGVTTLVALAALALTSIYVMANQRKVNDSVQHARVKATQDAASLSNMNAVAQFKALLNNGKVDNEYLPALFPQNYWLADWRQMTKNPRIPTDDVALKDNGWIRMSLVDTGDVAGPALENVFAGSKSQTALKQQDGYVRILKANFKRSMDYDYVESVDVEVKTNKTDKGQSSSLTSKARIPVPVPQPYNPILQISPAGTNLWSTDFSNIGIGEYDLRVIGSGVVYKAVIYVNNDPIELSVFNKDTGEPTNHRATNVLARNEVVGTTRYQFVGFDGDPATCSMTPANGQYTIRAVLYNAKGTVSEAPLHEVSHSFTLASDWDQGRDLSDAEFKAACKDECPYYEGDTYKTAAIADIQDRKYGDYARDHQLVMRNSQLKIKSVKFCENIRNPAEQFLAKNGRLPTNFDELGSVGWQSLEYVYYTVPSCKRKFLFVRGACGCFAEETMITLGDGKTQKRITELTERDLVWNPITRRAQAITRMTRGPEKVPMLDIQIEGKTVRVTGTHPFPTQQGPKAAFELQEGDRVRTEKGTLGVIQKIASAPVEGKAPVVWNLELEAGDDLRDHYVLANGVVTGDLYIQTRLQKNMSGTDRWVYEK